MDKQNYQSNLKSLYFSNQREVKKREHYSTFKDTKSILKNIVKKPSFSKIKERSFLHVVLKKILLKSQLDWISYSYIKDTTLIIFAKSPAGQSELNYQKTYILKSLHTIDKYKKINKISIIRDNNNYKANKINNKLQSFCEKSHGIFDNHVTNQRLFKIIENIRLHIKKLD